MVFINNDTFIYTDTISVPGFSDTFYLPGDTIIDNDTLYLEKRGDSLGLRVKPRNVVIRDTIYREIPVKGKVVKVKEPMSYFGWIAAAILFLLMMAFAQKK